MSTQPAADEGFEFGGGPDAGLAGADDESGAVDFELGDLFVGFKVKVGGNFVFVVKGSFLSWYLFF